MKHTAYQALEPRNQLRVHLFFNRALLLGICGEPQYKLIDANAFNFSLVRCNCTRAWALKCYMVHEHGHYSKGGVTFSAFLAIEPGDPRLPPHIQGSIVTPRRWFKVIQNGGATVTAFHDFVDYICTDIEQNRIPGTDDHRIFLWDNLNSHLAHYVTQTVEGRPGPQWFSTCPRPPYQPKYGPVEYKICDVIQDMKLKAREE